MTFLFMVVGNFVWILSFSFHMEEASSDQMSVVGELA